MYQINKSHFGKIIKGCDRHCLLFKIFNDGEHGYVEIKGETQFMDIKNTPIYISVRKLFIGTVIEFAYRDLKKIIKSRARLVHEGNK